MRNEEAILKKLNWLEDELELEKENKGRALEIMQLQNAIDELRWVVELE